MKIYVATSWRNKKQSHIVDILKEHGHDVYDFKKQSGFHWENIDENYQNWNSKKYRNHLNHHLAVNGFFNDFNAMKWAEICVLVMPCGRSAHLEAGYFVGVGKKLIILLSEAEPELMYKMANYICITENELLNVLGG